MDNIDFDWDDDWDEAIGQLDEYDDYYYTTSSEWFDEQFNLEKYIF